MLRLSLENIGSCKEFVLCVCVHGVCVCMDVKYVGACMRVCVCVCVHVTENS